MFHYLSRRLAMLSMVAMFSALIVGSTSEPAHATAPSPSWWSGTCDVNNYPGSYALSASYNGVITCGPGPTQGGTDHLVYFYSGAWGEYEWECVELVMRYMYLVYGIAPYNANGDTVVSNYSGTLMAKVSNNGSSLPSPGDIISESTVHTAIVTAVNVTNGSGTVTIMQQNASSDGWGTISVSGNVLGSSVTGWLHYTAGAGNVASYSDNHFNSDNYSDLALLTDNGMSGTGTWVLTSTDGGLNGPVDWWGMPSFGWNGIKSVTGDFNGDGHDDLALLTDEGGSPMSTYGFRTVRATSPPLPYGQR